MLGVLAQIDGYDPVAGAGVTLRGSSLDDADVCHLNGQVWWPSLIQLPTLAYDLFDGGFGGAISTPASSMALALEPWPLLPRYNLADARIQLWTGTAGAAWGDWTRRFDGRVLNQPPIDQGLATLGFSVDDRWLDKPLLSTYAGTTGAEGPAALKGTVKPLALGAPRYATGVLVDPVNLVFQVSGYGLIEDFEVAMERLLRFGASLGDYATFAALVAANVPRGTWATCKALGMVRFGAPPTGQISFLLKGDKAGPNGWARKPGQMIRRIALLAGGAGKIDDASLDALDAARPYNLSIFVAVQTTARELIQSIAASVNAVAGVSWLGKLFVAPVGIGAPSLTLQADGSALPPVAAVQQSEMGTPWGKLAIEAERTVTVHGWGDIASDVELIDLGDYSAQPAGTVFREGNVVQDQGASWRYVNPVPTAGNAPPVLPTTSNAYWRVMAPPGANAKLLRLEADRALINYNAVGGPAPSSQTTTCTVKRQNKAAAVTWSIKRLPDGTSLSTSMLTIAGDGLSATMTAAAFNASIGTTYNGVEIIVTSDGMTSSTVVTWAKDGAAGANGTNGTNGRDAIVYYQEGTPTGMIAGDTWYKPSTKAWQRYNGTSWQPLLGAIASFDALNASYIVAGTIIASHFLLDNGVDLAAVVPGALNTAATATQGAAISLPITVNSPNTSGPNGNGTQAIVTTPAVPIVDAGDSVFVNGSFVVTAGTARGFVMLQKSTDGSTWADVVKVNQDGSFQGVTAKTHSFSLEDTDHAAGNLYFRILMRQSAAQSLGDGTAGTNFTITSGTLRVRRFFSK